MKKFFVLLLAVFMVTSAFSQQIYNSLTVKNLLNTSTATFNTAYSGLAKLSSGVLSASSLVNSDVSASAAIAYSKLNLTGSILNADVSASAAIAYSKLSLSNSILNADINSSAAIAYSKLAAMTTGKILAGNAGVPTAVTLSGGATIGATGILTLGNTAVTGQAITGYTSGAGTISATDSLLQAIQKLNGNDSLKLDVSALTTKGDIVVATAASTITRQGVGANDTVLMADSGQTNGLKWASPRILYKNQDDGTTNGMAQIQAPYAQFTTILGSGGARLLETDSENMLQNPNFENDSSIGTGWTLGTSNTLTTETSTVFSGNQSALLQTSATVAFSLKQNATPRNGLAGTSGEATWAIKVPAGVTDGEICSLVNNSVQTCIPAINDATFHEYSIPIVFGTAGQSAGVFFKTTATYASGSQIVVVDKARVRSGEARNYFSGAVGIGSSSVNANALIDIQSTTKAAMPFPRMTTTQKNAIASPTAGMVVFDTTLGTQSTYSGSAWVQAAGSSAATVTTPSTTNPVFVSASVSTTGVVSNEHGNWLTGNCTNANPSQCTMTGFTAASVNCVATAQSTADRWVTVDVVNSVLVEVYQRDGTGVLARTAFKIMCHGI